MTDSVNKIDIQNTKNTNGIIDILPIWPGYYENNFKTHVYYQVEETINYLPQITTSTLFIAKTQPIFAIFDTKYYIVPTLNLVPKCFDIFFAGVLLENTAIDNETRWLTIKCTGLITFFTKAPVQVISKNVFLRIENAKLSLLTLINESRNLQIFFKNYSISPCSYLFLFLLFLLFLLFISLFSLAY